MLWEILEGKPPPEGALRLNGCRFIDCTFERVGIAEKANQLNALRATEREEI
jgi:hypothetical protein